MKICKKCGSTEFSINGKCKACRKAYRDAHIEQERAYRTKYRAVDGGKRVSDYSKAWRKEHKERLEEYHKKWRTKNSRKIAEYISRFYQNPSNKYKQYEKSASKRGISFNLSEEQFFKLWQQPCFYCGSDIMTIGVDRVDNSRGYEEGNIVPCCSTCNYMKNAKSFDEYVEHCLKIAVHWK